MTSQLAAMASSASVGRHVELLNLSSTSPVQVRGSYPRSIAQRSSAQEDAVVRGRSDGAAPQQHEVSTEQLLRDTQQLLERFQRYNAGSDHAVATVASAPNDNSVAVARHAAAAVAAASASASASAQASTPSTSDAVDPAAGMHAPGSVATHRAAIAAQAAARAAVEASRASAGDVEPRRSDGW